MRSTTEMLGAMTHDPRRVPGDPLSPHERALLAVLCSGTWHGTREARQQLVHARWGGLEFDGCECFLVEVPADLALPRIPKHSGGPFATVDVSDGNTALGHLNLWVEDGLLHSVDYMTFDAPDEHLPAVELLGDGPFKA